MSCPPPPHNTPPNPVPAVTSSPSIMRLSFGVRFQAPRLFIVGKKPYVIIDDGCVYEFKTPPRIPSHIMTIPETINVPLLFEDDGRLKVVGVVGDEVRVICGSRDIVVKDERAHVNISPHGSLLTPDNKTVLFFGDDTIVLYDIESHTTEEITLPSSGSEDFPLPSIEAMACLDPQNVVIAGKYASKKGICYGDAFLCIMDLENGKISNLSLPDGITIKDAQSVAIEGNTIAVGATSKNARIGSGLGQGIIILYDKDTLEPTGIVNTIAHSIDKLVIAPDENSLVFSDSIRVYHQQIGTGKGRSWEAPYGDIVVTADGNRILASTPEHGDVLVIKVTNDDA